MSKIALTSILIAIFSLQIFCQEAGKVIFRQVTDLNGEPIGKINAIGQDKRGYMWFALAGKCLVRYDGVRFKYYWHDNVDENTLGGVSIETLFVDDDGIVWVGTGEGLDRLDPVTEKFTHYRHNPNDPSSISGNGVGVILKDSKGRLWLGADGLDLFDEKSSTFKHFKHDPKDPKSLSDNVVRALYEDKQGTLWIGTGWPFFNFDPERGGLNRLEKDGTFTRFMHDPKNPNSLITNKVRAIFEDSRGVFWIGTNGDGLHTMDRQTGKITRHLYDPLKPEKLSRSAILGSDWERTNDEIAFISEDRLGQIWIGSMWNGVNRYDPVKNKTTHYEGNDEFTDTGGGYWAYQSRDGTMWLSTEGTGKLWRIDFYEPLVDNIELGASVHHLDEDAGSTWASTEQGLFQLDEQKKIIGHYLIDPANKNNPANNLTSFIDLDKNTLLVGSHEGVWKFSKRSKEFSILDLKSNSPDGKVGLCINIFLDHDGFLWVTTQIGLVRQNPKTGETKWYSADAAQGSIGSNNIICIGEAYGSIWVGTSDNGGLNRWDKKTDTFKRYLTNTKETGIFIDRDQNLWIGTSSGLYHYDEKSDDFLPFSTGTLVGQDRIFGIIADGENNLWIETPEAITQINKLNSELTTFSHHVGIRNISVAGFYKSKSGNLWLGHDNGFYIFNPKALTSNEKSLKILLPEILINDQAIQDDNGEEINADNIIELNLSHSQNNLIIKYSADDYRAPEATRFTTILEGYDNNRRQGTLDKTTFYYNLPPGDFTYRVKATNAFGIKGEKKISIHISPPWWRTWWAYAGYSFLAVFILYISRREIVRRERLHSAFKLKNVELEKVRAIDKVKSAFFTNISHEFRTPLSLIKGPAQDLMEKYHEDSKTQEKLKLIQRNADLLLKLINQLLNLSKLEAGEQKLEETEFDLYYFIRAVASSFSSMAKQKGVSYHVQLLATECNVLFDKDKLETILINLINNAIKFTPSGGSVYVNAEIVDTHPLHENNKLSNLHLRIKDTGIGIARNEQSKIFERFYQVSETHKEVGTGIGLSLVKELVQLMNGDVEVISSLNKGSEFIVKLPINVLYESPALAPEFVPEISLENGKSDNHEPTLHGVNDLPIVLVVEDNFDMRKFIIESLGDTYCILESENGKEGIEKAIKEIPQLIISDVMMPVVDGIEMTKKIKKDFRTCHIPIILLTAKINEESKLEGLEIGADDYIVKPFNKKELLLKVRNNISGWEKIREKIRVELLREAPKLQVQSADEKFLVMVRDTIQKRLSDRQLGVESLAEVIGMSRVQLYRKINALTGLSVNEMIRTFRLQKAAQLVEQNWGSISQIASKVGFSNPSYFSKCFKEKFGVMPSEFVSKKV